MKRLFFIVLLEFFLSTAYSQYAVTGSIIDSSNVPVAFATIVLKKDSVIKSTSITDSAGNFKIVVTEKGTYSLSLFYFNSNIGINSFYLINDTIINLQVLLPNNHLKEVIVGSKKPIYERKGDRIIFNVENSVASIGTDAFTVLSKSPEVRIQNDKISLIGKSGVSIMINDKLLYLDGDDLINYLKSIPSDNISKIEIITTPPAQYDAQGNSGLINIVLKRSINKGYNGNIRTGYTQKTYSLFTIGTVLNYNIDKFRFYINLDAGDGSSGPILKNTTYYNSQTWVQTNDRRSYQKYLNGTFGCDYQLASKTLLGISYYSNNNKPNLIENVRSNIYNGLQTIDSTLQTDGNTQRNTSSNDLGFQLIQKFDSTSKKLTIDADFFTHDDNRQKTFENSSYDSVGNKIPNSITQYLSSGQQVINIQTLNAVFEFPYKTSTISFGGKLTFINNRSDNSFYQLISNQYQIDSAQSDQFKYTENTQALFANINKTIQKWMFQLGIRGEYTQTTGVSVNNNQSISNNYLKFFPTAYITYNLNSKNVFTIDYGKRINRPFFISLNPFRWYYTDYSYSQGNPFLQPSYNHNVDISYTYNNIITTTFSFSQENNGFGQITLVQNGSNIQLTTIDNFLTNYNYSLSTSASYNKLEWLESDNQIQLTYYVSKSNLIQTVNSLMGWGVYILTDNQIVFNKNKTLIGDIEASYQSPYIDGIYNNRASFSSNIGIKALVYHKKIQIAANVNDIFKSQTPIYSTTINSVNEKFNNYYDSRYFSLSLRYNFGNKKVRKIDPLYSNEDEKNRAR